MAKKEFRFHGLTSEELMKLDIKEFAELIPSRERRKIKRGFTPSEETLLKKLRKGKRDVETHCRDMVILPEMIGKQIKVYNGKTYILVAVSEEMIGHHLGEFALTRNRVAHNAPGVGATKSSSSISVR